MATTTASVEIPALRVTMMCEAFQITAAERADGVVLRTSGVAGFRERMELARRYLPAFGVASVCGFGRVPREELPAMLQDHRDCAVELQRAEAATGASAP